MPWVCVLTASCSSLGTRRFMYPGHCCKHAVKGDMDFNGCTRRDAQDNEVGKSVLRPSKVRGMSTHHATVVLKGSTWLRPPPSQILLKHVKFSKSWGYWPEHNCSKLPDDDDMRAAPGSLERESMHEDLQT